MGPGLTALCSLAASLLIVTGLVAGLAAWRGPSYRAAAAAIMIVCWFLAAGFVLGAMALEGG